MDVLGIVAAVTLIALAAAVAWQVLAALVASVWRSVARTSSEVVRTLLLALVLQLADRLLARRLGAAPDAPEGAGAPQAGVGRRGSLSL